MPVRQLWIVRHGESTSDQTDLSEAGRQQADLLGFRLAGLRIRIISHSPRPRAARTAAIVAAHLPAASVHIAPELDDRVPTDDPAADAAMIARFTGGVEQDLHELIVTHNFQVAWFVRDALAAPAERFRVVNSANTGLTVIRYPTGRPPRVLLANDLSHLPPELRWTGLPSDLIL